MSTVDVDLLLTTEVALFFQRNPFTVESAEGLARKLGLKTEHVRKALELLVNKKVLRCEDDGKLYIYAEPYIVES